MGLSRGRFGGETPITGTEMTMATQFLVYRTQTGHEMRAAVRVAHGDGSFTVEPFFWQKNGKDTGMFQGGHTLRVDAEFVTRQPQ